jgi:hypothetical protein
MLTLLVQLGARMKIRVRECPGDNKELSSPGSRNGPKPHPQASQLQRLEKNWSGADTSVPPKKRNVASLPSAIP